MLPADLPGWCQAEAKRSSVLELTIACLESMDRNLGGRAETSQKIRNVIEAADIQLSSIMRQARACAKIAEVQVNALSAITSENSSAASAGSLTKLQKARPDPAGLKTAGTICGTIGRFPLERAVIGS
jgi:hypothetical protein